MAEYLTNTTDVTKVASAIREKGGTSNPLVYPDGFVTAINNIQTGGSSGIDGVHIGQYTITDGVISFSISKDDYSNDSRYRNLYAILVGDNNYGMIAFRYTSTSVSYMAMCETSSGWSVGNATISTTVGDTQVTINWTLAETSASVYYEGVVNVYALPAQ